MSKCLIFSLVNIKKSPMHSSQIQEKIHVGSINISRIYRDCLQYNVYSRRHRGCLIQYLAMVMSNTDISQYRSQNLLMLTSCLNLENADRYFTRKKLKYYNTTMNSLLSIFFFLQNIAPFLIRHEGETGTYFISD